MATTGRAGRHASAVILLPAVLLALAGCGADTVSADAVARGAAQLLEPQLGFPVDVFCPNEIQAREGVSTHCTVTGDGIDGEYVATVTVASVDGDRTEFDVAVENEPLA